MVAIKAAEYAKVFRPSLPHRNLGWGKTAGRLHDGIAQQPEYVRPVKPALQQIKE